MFFFCVWGYFVVLSCLFPSGYVVCLSGFMFYFRQDVCCKMVISEGFRGE